MVTPTSTPISIQSGRITESYTPGRPAKALTETSPPLRQPKWSGFCAEEDRCSVKEGAFIKPLGFYGLAATCKFIRNECKDYFITETTPSPLIGEASTVGSNEYGTMRHDSWPRCGDLHSWIIPSISMKFGTMSCGRSATRACSSKSLHSRS
jgi:hypothetical protein